MDSGKVPAGVGTLVRLVVLSIVVGVVLSALNIRPQDLFFHVRRLIDFVYSLGFGAVEWAFQYLLLGAVVVVPIWVVSRLISGMSRRGSGDHG